MAKKNNYATTVALYRMQKYQRDLVPYFFDLFCITLKESIPNITNEQIEMLMDNLQALILEGDTKETIHKRVMDEIGLDFSQQLDKARCE